MLETFIERRGFRFVDLRKFQVQGIQVAIQRSELQRRAKGPFIVAPTGSGKTIPAYFLLGRTIVDGGIGVYLVPHTQLLDQKVEELEEFFRGYVHVVKMSGEFQPTQEELQTYRDRLIIVATYESFRSFLFEVQHRQYFQTQKIFGGVVVDEIHMLGDEDRGWKLESLLYKLQKEHKARFCCLSATFTKADAQLWSARLGCQLIYENPSRDFSYLEIIKYKAKKSIPSEERDTIGQDREKIRAEKSAARQEKIEAVIRECWKFIVGEHIVNMTLLNVDEEVSYKFLS
jgi:replicative superfamily II helicase